MLIITDSPNFCADFLIEQKLQSSQDAQWQNVDIKPVVEVLLGEIITNYQQPKESFWKYLLITESADGSQFDALINLSKKHEIADKVLCIAGSGKKFHGFRKRPWVSLPGNIHLSVHLKPNQEIKNFAAGLTILSAVSVVQAIDEIEELSGEAKIKWINDIVISKAKVSGVIAQSQLQAGNVTNAILGIGVNVEARPEVVKDSYIPEAACLNDFLNDKIKQSEFFPKLISKIEKNYKILISDRCSELIEFYRDRSIILGNEVLIMTDPVDGKPEQMVQGKVAGIGDNLELFLEGHKEPITKGRLILF
jgi:BirA family biotin operon repressor/biotin-[acetyl-CoA-carboxylase] ligase